MSTSAPPTAHWADIGVNLGDKQFWDDRDAVLQRAADANVTLLLLTGTGLEESRQALALCHETKGESGTGSSDESNGGCGGERGKEHGAIERYATAGVHPHNARFYDAATEAGLKALLAEPAVLCGGEMGLDFNRDFSPRPDQEQAFEAQLALAAAMGKPVFLHERDAHERFHAILKTWRDQLPAAVVHCFTGDRKALHAYLDLDCHIGITGWVCDERRGKELAALVPSIPDERLLLETDAPYLLPRDLPDPPPRKRRNEPCLLPWIGQRVAALRDISPESLAALTLANTRRFLGLSAPAAADC